MIAPDCNQRSLDPPDVPLVHQDLQQLRAFFIAKDASAVPQGISPTRVDEVCRPLHALLRLLGTPSEPLLQLWEDHESVRAAAAAAATGTSGGAVASGATPCAQHGAWPVIGTWGVAEARGDVLTTAQGDVWSLPQIVQVG